MGGVHFLSRVIDEGVKKIDFYINCQKIKILVVIHLFTFPSEFPDLDFSIILISSLELSRSYLYTVTLTPTLNVTVI